ncbi:MAG: MarC family protein, partial [Escherichia coli]
VARNKPYSQPVQWPLSCQDLAFSRRHDSATFSVYQLISFRIAGGILVGDDSDVDDHSGKLGEDKYRTSKKNQKPRHVKKTLVAPLALPLMAGLQGRSVLLIVWGTRYHSISWLYLFGFFVACCIVRFMLLGIVPHGTVAGNGFYCQTGINVITRIAGLLLMALGIEFIVTGIKGDFPRPA